jgi:anti-sigma-K factor RskA
MDLKEYISSGILELYASGALDEAEAREVEAMAGKHPEVKAELDAIQNALTGYTETYRKNPRPELRQRILDKIDQIDEMSNLLYMQNAQPSEREQKEKRQQRLEDELALKQQPFSAPPEEIKPPVSQVYEQRSSRSGYLMAAVWIFLVLNVAGNIFFYTKLRGTQEQMSTVINENNKMKSEYEKIKSDMEKKTGDMKMVMNRSNKVVDMKGMEIAPQSFATVYWNPNTKQVMLNVDNLPKPPSDKQYQLWALKDGKPIDAGVFEMKPGDMHMMPVTIPDADAFAITLEKKGGSPTPDLTQLYVMGNI